MKDIKKLKKQIAAYTPYNEQEAQDKKFMLDFLEKIGIHSFYRDSIVAHFTTSAFIFNKEHTKVLMCEHIIDNSLSWIGGHADGIANLMRVVCREINEETGITNYHPVKGRIAALTCIAIPGHEKNGKYVSSHVHMDVAYIFEADEDEELKSCPGENTGVRWVTLEEMRDQVADVWKTKRVYEKLIERYA